MPTYKLTYFQVKGRAETTRLVFALGGIPFEDKRVEFKDWPALKPSIPTGQLPCLEVDGKMMSESMTIARFAAREAGLASTCSFEQAKIEEVVDRLNTLNDHLVKFKYNSDVSSKNVQEKDIKEKHIPGAVKVLETLLGNKKTFVTDKLNLADLHFFTTFETVKEWVGVECTGKLKGVFDSVANDPKIAAYLKKRPN